MNYSSWAEKGGCSSSGSHARRSRKWDNNDYLKAIRFGTRRDWRYRKGDTLKRLKK
jgi:hypothetical protein